MTWLSLVGARQARSWRAGWLKIRRPPCCSSKRDLKQVPRSLRRNALPVELINRALLMGPEHVACALVELQQIGKTASGADGVLHHPPEAFDGVEVVPTMSG